MTAQNASHTAANRAKSALTALLCFSFALCIALPFNAHGKSKYTVKIVPFADWDTWEPVPCFFMLHAKISANAKEKGHILFNLRDVTLYPGAYMNDQRSGDTDNDLKFAEPEYQNTRGGQIAYSWEMDGPWKKMKVKWKKAPADLMIPIVIYCRDYAAWGKLEATLYKCINLSYKPVASSCPFKIPKDDYPVYKDSSGNIQKGNRIADNWDHNHKVAFTISHLRMDRDSGGIGKGGVPHGKNVGDGLSVHEEYRGFKISGFHTRLDPLAKDVLLYSELSENDDVHRDFVDNGDIGHAGNLPGINAHQIYKDESDGIGRVNFRKTGYSSGNQYRIRVYAENNPPRKSAMGNTPWKLSDGRQAECQIFVMNIEGNYWLWDNDVLSDLLDAVMPMRWAMRLG